MISGVHNLRHHGGCETTNECIINVHVPSIYVVAVNRESNFVLSM